MSTFICQLINKIQFADKYSVAFHIIRHVLIVKKSDSVWYYVDRHHSLSNWLCQENLHVWWGEEVI